VPKSEQKIIKTTSAELNGSLKSSPSASTRELHFGKSKRLLLRIGMGCVLQSKSRFDFPK